MATKLQPDPHEEGSPIGATVEKLLSAMPVFICGVNRKANIGNFENIDVYSAVVLPLPDAVGADAEELRATVAAAAELGFEIVSTETFQRYDLIKKMQSEK